MKQKELSDTFKMISNWKPFVLHGLYESISALKGLRALSDQN